MLKPHKIITFTRGKICFRREGKSSLWPVFVVAIIGSSLARNFSDSSQRTKSHGSTFGLSFRGWRTGYDPWIIIGLLIKKPTVKFWSISIHPMIHPWKIAFSCTRYCIQHCILLFEWDRMNWSLLPVDITCFFPTINFFDIFFHRYLVRYCTFQRCITCPSYIHQMMDYFFWIKTDYTTKDGPYYASVVCCGSFGTTGWK